MASSLLRILAWVGILLISFGIYLDTTMYGPSFGSTYITVGVILIIAAVLLAMMPKVLRNDSIMDTWTVLITNAHGKGDEVLSDTEAFIKETKAPAVNIKRKNVVTGMVMGIAGTGRQFLVLTDERSFTLAPYQIFVNARDYGDNLEVSWHLTYRPTIFQAIASLFAKAAGVPKDLSDLNVFDEMDLTAFVLNTHHCIAKTVTKIMTDLGQDVSTVDWKSRGFLGVS